ncbi:hypothetical protein BY458DRAFT_491063 [Sporodiniella umbellata]|nr:hypothetical protein BY458DRAFT_491063 [Sporodiniella umbellata]
MYSSEFTGLQALLVMVCYQHERKDRKKNMINSWLSFFVLDRFQYALEADALMQRQDVLRVSDLRVFHVVENSESPVRFQISFCPKYQDPDGRIFCSPGSVFEGTVKVTLSKPMPVSRIKLIFKASEKVNYYIMGWEQPKDDISKLFTIRTTLWGFPSDVQLSPENCFILEQGEYTFPFLCQMPVINFPPSFENHLIATNFHLFAALESPQTTILSKPFSLDFQPIVEVKSSPVTECIRLKQNLCINVVVPCTQYSLLEPIKIPIEVQFSSLTCISQLLASVKRVCRLDYKSFSNTETTTIASYSQYRISALSLKFPLKIASSPKPTLSYSRYFTIEYRLVVTVKVRYGVLQFRKKLLDVPITLGTLPLDVKAPRQIEAYSHLVENTTDAFCKPSFLKPPEPSEEYLPAYDHESMPPVYSNYTLIHI